MTRHNIIQTIGSSYLTSNIEGGEYSYVKEAGSKAKLKKALGKDFTHYKLDLRFEKDGVVVLVETKQTFVESDYAQLAEYVAEEKALNPTNKIIAIIANTNDDIIRVWKDSVDYANLLKDEISLDEMDLYNRLFEVAFINDRETVLKNTFALNELLHKLDIDENKRSQFVGTILLYVKKMTKKIGTTNIDKELKQKLNDYWELMDSATIVAEINSTLDELLDGSDNKHKKVELLQQNVLNDQKVKKLTKTNWLTILNYVLFDIYRYINADSSEGQDILNMFFIAFNKYTGNADKNQAFTPDHITEFRCRVTDVDRTKVVLDATCGSGSFLVKAMVKELADCRKGHTESEASLLMKEVKEKHIYGIEVEERAYGLATTNMLIHGDGNSNIKFGSCFECKEFIKKACPDIILMNPPYNAKPIGIPDVYKSTWGKSKDGKEDPTKGLVFIQFISDVIKEMNSERIKNGESKKDVKLAVLLPVSAAIGTKSLIAEAKEYMLKDNRLEAVFTLPSEIFYPGAAVNACCMLFTLGVPHVNADGTTYETFFGFYKEDGFKKKKSLGRVEQFDSNGNSKWRSIEENWLKLFRNKRIVDGLSATAEVNSSDEWLCEAYMKTDYSQLTQKHFQRVVNNYISYLVKNEEVTEADWGFIQNYMFVFTSHTTKKPLQFDISNWKEFKLSKILSLRNGKGITSEDIEFYPGSLKAVQSGEDNNGVIGKIDINYCVEKAYTYTTNSCLTVARTGSAGFVSFQKSGCVVGDSAKLLLLEPEHASVECYLFIQTVLLMNKFKYDYGRKVTEEKYLNETIVLPVLYENKVPVLDSTRKYSDEGFIPDWDFMERYIKYLPYGDKI